MSGFHVLILGLNFIAKLSWAIASSSLKLILFSNIPERDRCVTSWHTLIKLMELNGFCARSFHIWRPFGHIEQNWLSRNAASAVSNIYIVQSHRWIGHRFFWFCLSTCSLRQHFFCFDTVHCVVEKESLLCPDKRPMWNAAGKKYVKKFSFFGFRWQFINVTPVKILAKVKVLSKSVHHYKFIYHIKL